MWSGFEGRLSPSYNNMETVWRSSEGRTSYPEGRLSPAYYRSNTYPPPRSPTNTESTGRLTKSMKATVFEEISLEEFDFFSKENLFDNSDSKEENTEKLGPFENTDHSYTDETDSSKAKKKKKTTVTIKCTTTVKKAAIYNEDYITVNQEGLDAIVTYEYQIGCCSKEECYCSKNKVTENVDTWDEDEKSEIYFNLTDQYEENSGMELCSTKDGHFINVIDIESKYPPIMNLRSGDKVLGINGQAVSCFQHAIVMIMFRYLLFTDTAVERVTMVIERRNKDGRKGMFEIILDVKVTTRGNPAVNIHPSTNHSDNHRLLITAVKWNVTSECRIQNAWRSNSCIVLDSENNLRVTPILYADDWNNVFKCDIFSGLCRGSSRSIPKRVFIGVFRTWLDDDYIVASTKSKLTVVKNQALDRTLKKIQYADPRFFFVYKTSKGYSYFESMTYRGWYWRVDRDGRLEMMECKNDIELNREDIQFTFIMMKSDI